jgi:hypothetical protein
MSRKSTPNTICPQETVSAAVVLVEALPASKMT